MNGRGPTVIEYNSQTFTEDHIIEADSSFFNFFSIPVIKGDIDNLIKCPTKSCTFGINSKKNFR